MGMGKTGRGGVGGFKFDIEEEDEATEHRARTIMAGISKLNSVLFEILTLGLWLWNENLFIFFFTVDEKWRTAVENYEMIRRWICFRYFDPEMAMPIRGPAGRKFFSVQTERGTRKIPPVKILGGSHSLSRNVSVLKSILIIVLKSILIISYKIIKIRYI